MNPGVSPLPNANDHVSFSARRRLPENSSNSTYFRGFSLIDAFPSELLAGLAAGALGLLVSYLLPRLDWGLLWTLVALAGLYLTRPRAVGRFFPSLLPWAILVVVVLSAAAGALFADGRKENPWLLFISIGGVWATVPDTEAISILLGAAFPLAFASYPLARLTNSRVGGALAGLLSALVIISEAGGRVGALAGASGAVAVAALPGEGTIRLVRHLVLVAWWSRVAGRFSSGAAAVAMGVGFTLVALGCERFWRRYRERASS